MPNGADSVLDWQELLPVVQRGELLSVLNTSNGPLPPFHEKFTTAPLITAEKSDGAPLVFW